MILLIFMRQPFYSSAMVSSLYDGIFSYVRVPPYLVSFYIPKRIIQKRIPAEASTDLPIRLRMRS